MGLMYLLAAHLLKYRSILCPQLESGLLLSCFYIDLLWLRRFLWEGRRRVVFAPSFVYVWSQMPWRSRQIIVLPRGFLHEHLLVFNGYSRIVMSWIDFSESLFGCLLLSICLLCSGYIRRYSLWRCPWCNGYRRRIWTRRYEFKSWTRLIAFHIALIPLGKV